MAPLPHDVSDFVVVCGDGAALTGTPRWIDTEFIALQQDLGEELVLISRSAIALIRALV